MKLRIPANEPLFAWLLEHAPQRVRRVRARRRVRVDDLRCHPDLRHRLEVAAAGLHGVRLRYFTGLPALVHPNGVVFGIAAGTSWIALRLPPVGRAAVVRSEWGLRKLEGDWIDCDPWLTDMIAPEGTARLRGWCRASYVHAGEVGPPPVTPRQGPPAARRPKSP